MHSNPRSFNLPSRPSAYLPYGVEDDQPFDPLGALHSRQHSPENPREYSRQAMLSPFCLATIRNELKFVHFMHQFYQADVREDLGLALFLANREGYEEMASLLLNYGANPGQKASANGLHGAAWRGLESNIFEYVNTCGASPDVTDGSSATPIIYAILGTQDEERAWSTINCLFVLGANPCARFGSEELSYADIAQKGRKGYLARRLKECEACPSPTILNPSRESSPAVERLDDIKTNDNKRLREGSEANEADGLSPESNCTITVWYDMQGEYPRLQEGPESDGVAIFNHESSCMLAEDNDVQPSKKRPRQDPEVIKRAKRVRSV
ncbi:unnamed protein product [Fusarium graminearum]|nr:unnamed protein product [Fusarium graminearum]